MEKLLKLLNEYDKDSMRTEKSVYAHETGVISKKFWFIQWLVDTEQFDYWKVGEIENTYQWSLREKVYVVSDCVYESMLMLLAIQDDPISFLISILK